MNIYFDLSHPSEDTRQYDSDGSIATSAEDSQADVPSCMIHIVDISERSDHNAVEAAYASLIFGMSRYKRCSDKFMEQIRNEMAEVGLTEDSAVITDDDLVRGITDPYTELYGTHVLSNGITIIGNRPAEDN